VTDPHFAFPTPHVIVVGGGIAGLVTARELADGGVRVTLFEASDRLGGKVGPHTVGGIQLDAGAESFATRGGTVAALATELGLAESIVAPAAGGAWLQPRSGEPLPLPRTGLLGIPAVPLARDVIDIVGLPGALRAQLDALMSGFVGSRERNLGALVRKRMGRAVLDRLVVPVAGAIHSAHPDDLDVDVVAPRLRAALLSEGSLAKAVLTLRAAAPAGSAVQGIRGGMFRLASALAEDLDGRVSLVLGARVVGVDDSGVTLEDGSRHPSDRVVVAAELNEPTGAPITLATLVVEAAALDTAPRGTGILVAAGTPGVRARALTHASAKWAWLAERAASAHVLRLSYEAAPDADDDLRELARRDAERLLGTAIPDDHVLAFDRQRWRGPSVSRLQQERGAAAGVSEVGERVSGAGLAAVIAHAKRESGNLLQDLRAEAGLGLNES
jgi:oxygen-dependent protoporphyrinogen oxidase